MRHKEYKKRADTTDSLMERDSERSRQREIKLYKVWVKTKLDEDYIRYSVARRHRKTVVKTSKESPWNAYGEELSELCKYSPRECYKSV